MANNDVVPRDVRTLSVADRVVAEYDDGTAMPALSSPRPSLRAWSLTGRPVTQSAPDDHPHHRDLSLALPDVSGTTFWGGRTYVRDVGSTLLDNHGTQRVVDRRSTAAAVDEELEWLDRTGARLLTESRRIAVSALAGGWMLRWTSRLRAVEPGVTLGSPQTNGRAGAFYGGVFWRAPFETADVVCASGTGVDAAHGSESPWLAVLTDEVSLVATAPAAPAAPPPHWFIRTDGYVGFGPATATDTRREVPVGDPLELGLTVAVIDGRLSEERAAAIGLDLSAGRES